MPFKSSAQRRFMYSQLPSLAKKWSAEEKTKRKKHIKKKMYGK